ncbi:helix-turn-helix transcriptional regulator, partial [Rhizobium leguminosarum]
GQFPQRIKLGDRRVVWLESEVNNWMAEQISKNRD